MNLKNTLREIRRTIAEADWEIDVEKNKPEKKQIAFHVLAQGRLLKAQFEAAPDDNHGPPKRLNCIVLEIDGVPTSDSERLHKKANLPVRGNNLPSREEQFRLLQETLEKFGIIDPPILVSEDYVRGYTKVLALRERLNPQPKEG